MTAKISTEKFDEVLIKILSEMTAAQIIRIPGVYESVSEELNNQVIDSIEAEANIKANHAWWK